MLLSSYPSRTTYQRATLQLLSRASLARLLVLGGSRPPKLVVEIKKLGLPSQLSSILLVASKTTKPSLDYPKEYM
jgi:hypothetical protein